MNTGDVILDPWQKEILDYEGNILLCTGRQVGKTLIMARKCALYMVNHPNSQIIICSLTEDQAKLIIVMILDYLEKNYRLSIAKGKDKPTQNKITLKNKATALARPVGNTGDAVRGFTGDVLVLDEVSRFNEMIITSAKPVLLTTKALLWMCSTPYGKQGYFYESFLNKEGRFKIWHKSSEEVIQNRPVTITWSQLQKERSIKFLEDEKKDMSELSYGQEYLGLFLDELRQYWSDELINRVCILKRPPAPVDKTNNFMGVDLARCGGDSIVYSVIHKLAEDRYHHVENIEHTMQLTTETEQQIIDHSNFWQCGRVGIDAGSGSLGVGIFDRLRPVLGKRKVIPMNNRDIALDKDGKKRQRLLKEDMYDNMTSMMEKGELLLLDDPGVRLSLKSVQWEFREKGLVTKMHIFGNYTHTAEALVRGAFLAKKEKLNKLWISYI